MRLEGEGTGKEGKGERERRDGEGKIALMIHMDYFSTIKGDRSGTALQ